MPLKAPAKREHLHDRNIACRGFCRDDGLFDIEAHLTDTKSYDFPNRERGKVAAGEAVHDMWIRLTVDEDLTVREIQAEIDSGPFGICGDVTPKFSVLAGRQIGPGWTREVRRLLGGTQGCRHLVELLGTAATVAFQTVVPMRERLEQPDPATQPPHLDSCHALATDGPIVKRDYPKFYTGKK